MTTVYVMTHKKTELPESDGYRLLQVGAAGKQDLGYISDGTGENISAKNCYYGELTGMYWLWKNLAGEEPVGICHYRRFFMNDNHEIMKAAELDAILSEYDLITSKALPTKRATYWEDYAAAHRIQDMEATGKVIEELYPEDYPVFQKVMQGNMHYFGNLCVMKRKDYDAYCAWLFSIFSVLENRIDFNSYTDEYHKRVFGFLSEQLLMVWVQARGLRPFESRIMVTDEKAETKEFKLAIRQLIKMGQMEEARMMFYEILKIRPDLELPQSDLSGEIAELEAILKKG